MWLEQNKGHEKWEMMSEGDAGMAGRGQEISLWLYPEVCCLRPRASRFHPEPFKALWFWGSVTKSAICAHHHPLWLSTRLVSALGSRPRRERVALGKAGRGSSSDRSNLNMERQNYYISQFVDTCWAFMCRNKKTMSDEIIENKWLLFLLYMSAH